MRFTTLLQQPAGQRAHSYTLRYAASESFGRVARCRPIATPVHFAPGGASANDADIDAAAPSVQPSTDFAPGDSPLLYRTAGMRDLIADCSQWVVGVARRFIEASRQHQQARATYRALRGLDARMLRDIGLHRSEIHSVAAEFSGTTEATRIRVVLASRGL